MAYAKTGIVSAMVERFGSLRRVRFEGTTDSASGSAVLPLCYDGPVRDAMVGELLRIAAAKFGSYGGATAYSLELLDQLEIDWLQPTLSALDPTASVQRQMFVEIVSGQFARPLVIAGVDTFRLDLNSGVAATFCVDFWLRG